MAMLSWDDFIRHVVYCTNIQGSALYDATLGDKELVDDMYKTMVEEQSAKRKKAVEPENEYRPPRRGYSREVEAIYDLIDNIVVLRAEMGKWAATHTERAMSKRPMFPAEAAQLRMKARAQHRREDNIAKAQSRWRERRDGKRT